MASSKKEKYVNQWAGLAKGVSALATDQKAERVQVEMDTLGLSFDKSQVVKDIDTFH